MDPIFFCLGGILDTLLFQKREGGGGGGEGNPAYISNLCIFALVHLNKLQIFILLGLFHFSLRTHVN